MFTFDQTTAWFFFFLPTHHVHLFLHVCRDGNPISTPKLQLNNSKNNFGEISNNHSVEKILHSLSQRDEAHCFTGQARREAKLHLSDFYLCSWGTRNVSGWSAFGPDHATKNVMMISVLSIIFIMQSVA